MDLEKAEKMLYDSGFDDILLSDEQGKRMYVSELMAKFTNEVSKALLEEAAEKVNVMRVLTSNRSYEYGFKDAKLEAKESILSLIPKDS